MYKFRVFACLLYCVLAMNGGDVIADDFAIAPAPKKGKTPAAIVDSVVKAYGGIGKMESKRIHQIEYRHGGDQVFVIFFNPYSGRLAHHFHLYRYSQKDEVWHQFASHVFDGRHEFSADMSTGNLHVRDSSGKVVFQWGN